MFTIAILDAVRVTRFESHAARPETPEVPESRQAVGLGWINHVRRDFSTALRRVAVAIEPA